MKTEKTETPPKTIYEKLFSIMEAIETIHKDGYNDFHKYPYATEKAIKQAVRKELINNKLLFLSQIKSTEIIMIGEKSVTKLLLDVQFLDIENNEAINLSFEGTGEDKGDKGLYKALTGAIKYALTTTFLIPTGDDPEKEVEVKPKQEVKNKITPNEAVEISDLVKQTIEGATDAAALIDYAKGLTHLAKNNAFRLLVSNKLLTLKK